MFTNIVLALDGSPESLAAVPYARELVQREGGSIEAIHVRELLMGRAGGQTLNANEDEVTASVQRVVDELAQAGVSVTLNVATAAAGGPAHVIADLARRSNADLIVMGTRGRGQVAGLLLGSVTQRLLHLAHCPVMAVPPGAVALAEQRNAEAAAAHA
jgi:nucleotide-binding universal stress UspA family protein